MANNFLAPFVRAFHTSVIQRGEARILKKVLKGTGKKKFKYHDVPTLPSPTSFTKGAFEGHQSINVKRVAVLNKLFMRYITDLMATGECSPKFLGHGIEINRVAITPDFQTVNVFWIGRGGEKDDIIEDILHKNTGSLRHELAQLKVVGVIPKIQFLKDKHYAKVIEIERLLSKADFGDDYVPPSDSASKLRTELQLDTTLDPNIIKQISKLDKEEQDVVEEEPLPPMAQNVFGLNHNYIMEYIVKTKAKHSIKNVEVNENPDMVHTVNANPMQYASNSVEREAFQEFLEKRQVLKNTARKKDKTYMPEEDYLDEEWKAKQEILFNKNLDKLLEDAHADYIEEYDEVK